MDIDWGITQQFTSSVYNFIAMVTALILAGTAVYGLRAWREQMRVKALYDIARRLLLSVYKTRDAIHYVRNPFAGASEYTVALKDLNLDLDPLDPNAESDVQAALYRFRWQKVVEAVQGLDANPVEGEVVLGEKLIECLLPLRQKIGELHSNIELYLGGLKNPHRMRSEEHQNRIEDVIYGKGILGSEPNEYDKQLSQAIKGIENVIKPYLKI